MYTDTLTSQGLESASTWPILVFTNLLERNTNGVNTLLDEILSSVFGASFDEAVTRVAKLDYNTPIHRTRVTEDTLEGLGLYDIFEGDVDIGKAELELLISSLRIVKATFEWLDAYNWNTNLSLLKFDWDDYDEFKTKLAAMSPSDLPLRNSFLKDRNNGKMAASKASYLLAVDTMLSAYEHITDTLPQAVKDFKDDNEWIKDGLTKLKTAINGGTDFWVPETLPTGTTWDITSSSALFGVNMGKLFTSGQLSLDKLITLESTSPARPTFYGDDGTAITSPDQIANYSAIGFELKTAPVKEIVKGLDTKIGELTTIENVSLVPPEIAEILWDLYHR
jgi:hypothetical protein